MSAVLHPLLNLRALDARLAVAEEVRGLQRLLLQRSSEGLQGLCGAILLVESARQAQERRQEALINAQRLDVKLINRDMLRFKDTT